MFYISREKTYIKTKRKILQHKHCENVSQRLKFEGIVDDILEQKGLMKLHTILQYRTLRSSLVLLRPCYGKSSSLRTSRRHVTTRHFRSALTFGRLRLTKLMPQAKKKERQKEKEKEGGDRPANPKRGVYEWPCRVHPGPHTLYNTVNTPCRSFDNPNRGERRTPAARASKVTALAASACLLRQDNVV